MSAIDGKVDAVKFQGPPRDVPGLLNRLRSDGGHEVRYDRLTKLEALLLRAIYDYADAYSAFRDDVLVILADQEWSDADCAQIERLLGEEEADRQ